MTADQIRALLAEHSRDVRMDARHTYWICTNGKWARAKSVTQIIKTLDKPAVDKWAMEKEREAGERVAFQVYQDQVAPGLVFEEFSRVFREKCHQEYEGQRLADRAANIGTGVHKLIEHHQKRELGIEIPYPDVPDESHYAFAGWEEWAQRNDLRPIAMEQMVYSRKYRYAGTLDWLGLLRGTLTLCDWKSKAVYPEYRLQLAAYRQPLRDLGLDPKLSVVTIPREEAGEIREHNIENAEAAFEAFINLRSICDWLKETA